MNAPTTIPRSNRRDAYLPAIRALMPGLGDEETDLRASLMLTRDNASRSMRFATEEAHLVLQAAERIAMTYCMAPMPIEDLKQLRYLMIRLIATASDLQSMFTAGGGDADDGR